MLIKIIGWFRVCLLKSACKDIHMMQGVFQTVP